MVVQFLPGDAEAAGESGGRIGLGQLFEKAQPAGLEQDARLVGALYDLQGREHDRHKHRSVVLSRQNILSAATNALSGYGPGRHLHRLWISCRSASRPRWPGDTVWTASWDRGGWRLCISPTTSGMTARSRSRPSARKSPPRSAPSGSFGRSRWRRV